MARLWLELDRVARAALDLGENDHLRTLHLFQQQFLSAHFPPHNDHSEGSNLTLVILLVAESPEISKSKGLLDAYRTGITAFKSARDADVFPTTWFGDTFDAILFPSLCLHASDIPEPLPPDATVLKAALFYDVHQGSFQRLFPEQPFTPPLRDRDP